MELNYDQNSCCTAVCLTNFQSVLSESELRYKRVLGVDPTVHMMYGYRETTYHLFSVALGVLCLDFKGRQKEIIKGQSELVAELGYRAGFRYPRCQWGDEYEVKDLSTVFGFTAVGESGGQEQIEEWLAEFGFTGSPQRSSKKYRGDSLVTLWSMGAEEFAKKCEEIIKDERKSLKSEAARASKKASSVSEVEACAAA